MKSYLITPEVSPSYLKSFPSILKAFRPDYAMYRSRDRAFSREFAALCRAHNILCFLNSQGVGDGELDSLLPYFDGIHLKGTALSLIADFSAHCMVGFSAHSPKEVREALCNGASYATLSPIFATPHKGTPIGIESLRALDSHARARTFGLGGIDTPSKLAQLAQIENLYGFASIRYFLGEV